MSQMREQMTHKTVPGQLERELADLERLIERLRELDSHEYIKHCVCVEDIDISDRFIESAAALETLSARLEQAEGRAEHLKVCFDEAMGQVSAAQTRAERAEQEAEGLRKALLQIVEAYDAYRARGVMPAPNQYQMLVEAIKAGDAALASRKGEA
jgi:iron uptake system EfeUOB component EfeO/EfeM